MMNPLSLQNRPVYGRPAIATPNASLDRTGSLAAQSPNAGAAQQDSMSSMLMPMLGLIQQLIQLMMSSMGMGGNQTGGAGGYGGAVPGAGNPASPGGAPGGYGVGSPSGDSGTGGAGGAGGAGNAADVGNGNNPGGVPANDGNGAGGATQGTGAVDPNILSIAGNPATAGQDAQGNPIGNAANLSINDRRNIDYSKLKADQAGGEGYDNVRGGKQAFNGVTGQDAAIMHLGGRAHISSSETANGVPASARIYNNVLNNPDNFTPDEVSLVQQLSSEETQKYGFATGEGLDHLFVDQMSARGDIDPQKAASYHDAIDARTQSLLNNPNRDAVMQDASQELNITSDIGTLEKQSGMSPYEQAVYRLAGHATLFSGDGSINGDILGITLGNKNSLDGRDFAGQDTNIDDEALSLLQDDMASDGQLNGDSLKYANEKVLDKIFLGDKGVTADDVRNNAVQQGKANGRSMQDMMKSFQTSANDAIKQFGDMAKDHPIITAAGAGALAAGAGVCPFLAGTMAVGAGIAAGQKMMNKDAQPAGGGY